MNQSRFTEDQTVRILRKAGQKPVPEDAKKYGVSDQTIYGWRKRYGTLDAADVRRLRQLEQENGQLKKPVADPFSQGRTLNRNATQKWGDVKVTRECLAIDVAGGIRSRRVIEVRARLVATHGAPAHIRSDNGPEFVSRAVLQGLEDMGTATALNDPGKPWQNGADESFNGKFRVVSESGMVLASGRCHA